MGSSFDTISEQHRAFIRAQPFFVASAPSGPDGHVNLSPKGYDTLAVLGPKEVAYLDLTGSGAETIAHLRDNARMTMLFCSFGPKPLLLRLYGRGEVVLPGHEGFADLVSSFPANRGVRSVIRIAVHRVTTSCGYSVPEMSLRGERPTLHEWYDKRSDDELADYRAKHNAASCDGLPALA